MRPKPTSKPSGSQGRPNRQPRFAGSAAEALSARWSRRTLLAGAAGCFLVPLLDSLGGARKARADGAFPKRLVLLYTANGTYPEQWFPQTVRSETDFDLGPIHSPLADYRSNLVLLRGVHNEVATNPANNGGPHQRGIGGLFTGQMLQTGEFKDGCGSTAGWADGPSLDQRVAQLIGVETPFASLELGVRCFEDDVQGRISYAAAGAPLPATSDPRLTWQRLFGQAPPTTGADQQSRQRAIMQAVHGQYERLSPHLGRDDREKLSAHLALMEDLERRMGLLDDPEMGSCPAPMSPPTTNPDDENLMPEMSRMQLDLLATAFACDLTRVASVQYSTGFNRIRYPWLDSFEEGHSLSHSGSSDVEAWENLGRRQQWHAGEIRYLIDRLSQIPEGEGSVFDNTLIVWGTEVSQGNSHSLDNVPFLLAGGKSVGLRGGQFLDLPGQSHGNLLLAIIRMFGGMDAHFGHPDHGELALEQILA